MKETIRALLMLFIPLSLAYTTTPADSKVSSDIEKKLKIECQVEDGVCHVVIEKNGEKKEYSFPFESEEQLEEFLEEKLEDLELSLEMDEDDEDHFLKMYRNVLPQYGKALELAARGSTYLGVQVQELSDQLRKFFKVRNSGGVLISEVVEESPAEEAGLQAGDVILSVGRTKVTSTSDLVEAVRDHEKGDEVKIKIVRDGKRETISATLETSEMASPTPFTWFRKGDHPTLKFSPDRHVFDFRSEKEIDSFREELDKLKEQIEDLKKEIRKKKNN